MKNKKKRTQIKWLADHIWQFTRTKTRTKTKSERAALRARMEATKASVLIK